MPDFERVNKTASKKRKKKKKNRKLRVITILLCIVLFFEALYCFVVFTDIPSIKNLREMYIDTALSTMTHQWLASAFLPEYMVDKIRLQRELLAQKQVGDNSHRPDSVTPTEPSSTTDSPFEENLDLDTAEARFYELFWELNRTSFEEYLDEHPDVLANGWGHIYINEAGIYGEGTSIYTTMGEQVLAIDVENQILLVRVAGSKAGNGYQGVAYVLVPA